MGLSRSAGWLAGWPFCYIPRDRTSVGWGERERRSGQLPCHFFDGENRAGLINVRLRQHHRGGNEKTSLAGSSSFATSGWRACYRMLLTLLTTRQSTWSPPFFLAYSRFMYRSLLFCPLQSKNAPSPWLVERIVIIKEDEDPSPVALARGELLVAMRPCFYLVLPSSRSGRRRRMCRRLHRQDYSSASNDLLLCRWLPPHIYICTSRLSLVSTAILRCW